MGWLFLSHFRCSLTKSGSSLETRDRIEVGAMKHLSFFSEGAFIRGVPPLGPGLGHFHSQKTCILSSREVIGKSETEKECLGACKIRIMLNNNQLDLFQFSLPSYMVRGNFVCMSATKTRSCTLFHFRPFFSVENTHYTWFFRANQN